MSSYDDSESNACYSDTFDSPTKLTTLDESQNSPGPLRHEVVEDKDRSTSSSSGDDDGGQGSGRDTLSQSGSPALGRTQNDESGAIPVIAAERPPSRDEHRRNNDGVTTTATGHGSRPGSRAAVGGDASGTSHAKLAAVGGATTSSSIDFNTTLMPGRSSPLRTTANSSRLRSRGAGGANITHGSGDDGQRKVLTKLQRYAVEEGIFAPLHAALDESRFSDMVSRLYDPEPLRRRTLQDAKQRRQRLDGELYDSVQDVHLAEYWQRKQTYRLQQQQQQHHHLRSVGGRASVDHSSNNNNERSDVRPATCPPDVDAIGRTNDVAAESPSPVGRSSRRRTESAASSSSSSSTAASEASSPEWKEQRPARAARHKPAAGGGAGAAESLAMSEGGRDASCGGGGIMTDNSSIRSSKRLVLEVSHIHRGDLCGLWMAARPPSPYQRLMSRLSYSPKQTFRLHWLLQRKPPPPNGTLKDVPMKPPPSDRGVLNGDTTEGAHSSEDRITISSPRSVYVMLRLGILVDDLTPISLSRFYLEGSLKGVPTKVTEVHFAAHERHRQTLLQDALTAYERICAQVSQEDFIRKLYEIDPEEHREEMLSRERESIYGGAAKRRRGPASTGKSSTSADRGALPAAATAAVPVVKTGSKDPDDPVDLESANDPEVPSRTLGSNPDDELSNGDAAPNTSRNDPSALQVRLETAMKKQQRRQDKYMQQLERNATLLRERANAAREREEKAHAKHEQLQSKQRQEATLRHQQQVERTEKLARIRQEAIRKAQERQQELLDKIRKGELHAEQLAKRRHEIAQLRHEERKIREEDKEDKVNRREKQHDYENLLLIDKIRRKAGRVLALERRKDAAQIDLKERRERNLIEMTLRTEQFAHDLLAFERKHLA